ncbi:MAG TPA: serine hydrolase, partial [Thermoanaerobaculia bacterium]|nr:serine hydrolase [Thermoanaerobaculia bacterium]
MKSRAALFLSLLLLATSVFGASKKDEIDALLVKYNAARQFNGAALVANRDGVILKKGYGFANLEWNIPNTVDTKFRLGSITKQFTSMIVMQLVAEGKIKLDEKMTQYLPDYRADTGDRITIRHLLTHTSGIPSYTGQPGFLQNVSRNPYEVAAFVKQYASGDLQFEPGTNWAYNNSGYFLLGAIIEEVTGKKYEQVVRERIFDPLGMKNSGYDHAATILPKRASGYQLTTEGYRNADYLDMSIPYAAGSLYSTVEDLYKWDRALYETSLLSEDLKKTMFTPVRQNYAFGWSVGPVKLEDGTEIATINHGGGINGFNTLLTRVPETREVVILLDNTSRGDKLNEITSAILGVLRGKTPRGPRKSIIDVALASVEKDGVARAVAEYRELRKTKPDEYDFSESALNTVGYSLLQQGRVSDALEIFKLNTEMFPEAANPWDSLAEAYEASGNREAAIANYKKSLALNPQNKNAEEHLKHLEAPELKLDLDRYVGRYELAPGFVLAITRDGDTLKAQATGQPQVTLMPTSATEFTI